MTKLVDRRWKRCGRLSHGNLWLGVRLLIVVLTGRNRDDPFEVSEVVEKRDEDSLSYQETRFVLKANVDLPGEVTSKSTEDNPATDAVAEE